ncbi:hypothetical protein WICPIJ_009063 [Wickerhamomyces pijperi]|uniref:Pre-mRNA-splicing factor ISY1 n=1 Tax=Wickerhamomyces pijperi TaxID=599730 RepID=A0A9P8PQE8_WICPI|nr:hypothetical protein WICPIJ_009063 [Wickerhamomyces pijperi]
MSRKSDKSNTILFRLQEQQAAKGGYKDYNSLKRPTNPFKITSIKDLQGFKKVILQDLNDKINRINNASLGLSDYQILELNSDINGLLKQKWNYEKQIRDLNGVGSDRYVNVNKDTALVNSLKINGVRYFGLAKNLEDIQKLKGEIDTLKKAKEEEIKRQKDKKLFLKSLTDRINYNYFNDDEQDEELLQQEKELMTGQRLQFLKLQRQTEESGLTIKADLIDEINYDEDIEAVLVAKRREQLQALYNI